MFKYMWSMHLFFVRTSRSFVGKWSKTHNKYVYDWEHRLRYPIAYIGFMWLSLKHGLAIKGWYSAGGITLTEATEIAEPIMTTAYEDVLFEQKGSFLGGYAGEKQESI